MNPSANNKRIAKNTFYLYIRMIVTLVIGLYTSRVFLEVLGVEDYGIYNIVGGFVAMLSIFTNTIRSAAQRFITYALGKGDSIKLQQTFSTILTLYLLISIIIFILGECFGVLFLDKLLVIPENRMSAAYFVFHCSLIAFVIHLLQIPFHASIIAHERMNFFALMSIAEAVLKLLIVFLLYASPFDSLKSYALLLSIVSAILFSIYVIYCRKSFPETKNQFRIHGEIFKEIFSYSIWVTIGSSSSVIKEQGVNIVINNFCGVAMNAAKGVSMQIEHAVNMFSTNIGTAISPQITKSYASGDIARSIRLTFMMAKVRGILLLYLCVPLITEADYVLSIWLKHVPDHAVLFTKWVLILCIARTLDNSVVPLNLAVGKVKNVQILGGGAMLLNLPIAILFLWMGADPVSTVIVGIGIEFVVLLIVSLFLKRYIDFPVLKFIIHPVSSVMLVAVFALLIMYLFAGIMEQGFLRLIIVSTFSIVLVSLASYLVLLNEGEREVIKDFVKKKLMHKNNEFNSKNI